MRRQENAYVWNFERGLYIFKLTAQQEKTPPSNTEYKESIGMN